MGLLDKFRAVAPTSSGLTAPASSVPAVSAPVTTTSAVAASAAATPAVSISIPESSLKVLLADARVAPTVGRVWSPHQLAIFDDAALGAHHTLIGARAGSGKTTTLVEALRHVPQGRRILFLAFSKTIAKELQSRQTAGAIPKRVDIRTCHSFGYQLCRRAFDSAYDEDKTRVEISRLCPGFQEDDMRAALRKTVKFAKGALLQDLDRDAIVQLVRRMVRDAQLDPVWSQDSLSDHSLDSFIDRIQYMLLYARQHTDTVDYDDMVYLPLIHDLVKPQYERVFVDELQDLDWSQYQLAKRVCTARGRLTAAGDQHQAIFVWRGAEADMMLRVARDLEARELPLTTSYRCSIKVVEEARKVVPDFHAAPAAPEGSVQHVSLADLYRHAEADDFIVSRVNAPLMQVCLAFVRRGVKVAVLGKEFGSSLQQLVQKSKTRSCSALSRWVQDWQQQEIRRLKRDTSDENGDDDEFFVEPDARELDEPDAPSSASLSNAPGNLPGDVDGPPEPARSARDRRADDEAIQNVLDRAACIRVLCEDATSVNDVLDKIRHLFDDERNDRHDRLTCTTVHKCKGLERRRVWVLASTFRVGRSEEESNLWYVAVTRAALDLFIVDDTL